MSERIEVDGAKPADSGRVRDVEAAYRYSAPSWQEISAAEGDAIAALKVLHHAGSLINAQLPGTAQLCAKWPSLIGTIKAALATQWQGEEVAEVCSMFELRWAGVDSISSIVERNRIKVGDKLYTHPSPAASPAGVPDSVERCMHGCYCGCCQACKNGSCEPVKYTACDCIAAAPSAPKSNT